MKRAFKTEGQTWDDTISRQVKSEVARIVETSPENALHPARAGAFEALARTIERKIKGVAGSP
jgi:hypothetical protein